MEIADIVTSINGRDAGKRFIIIGTEDEYSFIANGKERRVEKPKKKKNKHLKFEDKAGGNVSLMLAKGEKVTNKELRRALSETDIKGDVPKCRKTT